ncbi:MAG: SPOR domain-containing protein [Muribaculaceae bacterium]|nr:SPOR domain-containing protein [Muribaculaceae bacterium]
MKKILMIALWMLCIAVSAAAQEPAESTAQDIVARINATGNIEVKQPAALAERLCTEPSVNAESGEGNEHRQAAHGKVGYRIQVFDDNNPRTARAEAQSRKHMVESRFPYLRTYVQFNSPYWRVKAGDFRSRSEAEAVLEEMCSAFPHLRASMRLVRDHINVAD